MAGKLVVNTINTDTSGAVFTTQNAVTGIAKAWVNFNGTNASIRNSFNVSSVTRTTTGVYTVSFTTNMPNANYVVSGSAGATNNGTTSGWLDNGSGSAGYITNNTVSSCRVTTRYVTNATADWDYVSVIIHGS